MRRNPWIWIGLLLAAFAAGQWLSSQRTPSDATSSQSQPTLPSPAASALPAEARDTLARIASGGPFAHRQDGQVFQNRERRLPSRPRGWYREYTVDTPGSGDRGARRIVTGGDPPAEFWYSDDHYRSFHRIDAQGAPR
jgi:guanyl-specific ribonuclease Sa